MDATVHILFVLTNKRTNLVCFSILHRVWCEHWEKCNNTCVNPYFQCILEISLEKGWLFTRHLFTLCWCYFDEVTKRKLRWFCMFFEVCKLIILANMKINNFGSIHIQFKYTEVLKDSNSRITETWNASKSKHYPCHFDAICTEKLL